MDACLDGKAEWDSTRALHLIAQLVAERKCWSHLRDFTHPVRDSRVTTWIIWMFRSASPHRPLPRQRKIVVAADTQRTEGGGGPRAKVNSPWSRTASPSAHGFIASSHSVHDGEIHDHFHTERPQEHYGPKFRRWHHRPQSPGVRWYKKYTERSLKNGRVLVIDYVRHDLSKEGTRKVSSQEITSIAGLRHLYASQRRDEAVLRVYHVQNADWAVQFLFKKFNIVERDDLVDSNFGRWLSYKHPAQARGGRPLLGGMAWQTQHDPWRGISKTSFGLDYLKIYKVVNPGQQAETDPTGKMMELNCYDEVTESPEYGYDVYGQRMVRMSLKALPRC